MWISYKGNSVMLNGRIPPLHVQAYTEAFSFGLHHVTGLNRSYETNKEELEIRAINHDKSLFPICLEGVKNHLQSKQSCSNVLVDIA